MPTPSPDPIGGRFAASNDWRAATLARARELNHEALSEVREEVKWVKPSNPAGVLAWSLQGLICTGEVYRDKVKLTFARGASLPDPAGLFNASLEAGTRRAIDLFEGDELDAAAFRDLVRAGAAFNAAAKAKGARPTTSRSGEGPRLLAGGNPQVPEGDGDAPVRAYIAAMPGWKREVGEQFDTLVERVVPGVKRAVRWSSPFYGVGGQGWFCTVHCLTRSVKVTFFRGALLEPPPPGKGKDPEVRWVDVSEGGFAALAPQLERWVRQAAALPGWAGF